MIHLVCSSCQASMTVKDVHASKTGKCPRCQKPIQVPSLADPTSSTAEGESLRLVAERRGTSNQLPINFADLVAVTLERNREGLTSIAKTLFAKKDESVMSTHPPMKDRVNRLKEKDEPGAFECELPATELFADFEGIAGKVSFAMFHQVVGKRINQAKYVSSHAYFVKHP